MLDRRPRIAVGGILHESNTFAKDRTDLESFRNGATRRGEEIEPEFAGAAHEVGGFFAGAAQFGFDLVPTLVANATPSGMVTAEAFEALTAELIERTQQAGAIDGILLALHGAMVVEGFPDGDAEVLRRLRAALGPDLPIVVTHDAHANVAPEEVELSTALVIYKEVPHTDQRERGVQAAAIMARIVKDGVRPAQAIEKPPLLYNILFHNTRREPMVPLVEETKRMEREDARILAASAAVGYQYADTPQMGPSIVVVTDGDVALARAEAKRLAADMWAHREQMKLDLPDAAAAVALAMGEERTPVVLVDMGDNIGGGSAGDGTVLLGELLRNNASGFVVPLHDPRAVELAVAARVGGRFEGLVGGKTDDLHGEPVAITGKVHLLYDGRYVEPAPRHGGLRYNDQGVTALIHLDGSDADSPNVVLLSSRRHPPFSLGQLTSAGIDPAQQKILVVKAAVAFRAAYEPVAGAIIEVDTPGLTAINPARFDYKRADRGMWGMNG